MLVDASENNSTPESHRGLGGSFRSISTAKGRPVWRRLLAFLGPGYIIAVGYMDPGNWATDISGGSAFGYRLLVVVLISSLMAMYLQGLCVRLGIATGKDLAQLCQERSSKRIAVTLWVMAELAIIACDVAEVVGAAVALQLLFHLPLLAGVLLTSLDVLIVLALQHKNFRWIEAIVIGLIAIIAGSFVLNVFWSHPVWGQVVGGLLPTASIITHKDMLLVAVGIIGATVMPHNLYLHSSIVLTRDVGKDPEDKRSAVSFGVIDSNVALFFAFFINAAILVVSAGVFHARGLMNVASIQQAAHMLSPLVGAAAASTIFAVALLASGLNSTLTGTMAGQIVMEGFIHMRVKQWVRRIISRGLAIVPAALVIQIGGEKSIPMLLILSQVVLSFQLPFAVVPLVAYCGKRELMGELTINKLSKIVGWSTAALIVILNVWLIYGSFTTPLGS